MMLAQVPGLSSGFFSGPMGSAVGFTLIGLSFVVGVSKVFSVWRRQPPVDAVFATKKEVERSNRALDKRLEKVDDAVAAIHTDIQTAMASISLNSAERARRIHERVDEVVRSVSRLEGKAGS